MERKGSLLSRFLLCSQFRLWPLGRWLASCNLFSLHHSRKLQPCLTFSVISVLLLKKIPLHLENRIVWTCQWTCLFLVMVLPLGRKHCYFLDVIWWGWGEKVAIGSWRPTETTVRSLHFPLCGQVGRVARERRQLPAGAQAGLTGQIKTDHLWRGC